MIEIALIVLLGATIQSAIGFAYSLVCLPLFLQAGLNLPEAVTISFVTSAFQKMIFLSKRRKDVEWGKLKVPLICCLLALPIGVYCLGVISGESKTIVKQVVGALVLLTVIVRTTIRIKPKAKIATGWGIAAGCGSGFLNGLANIGGPPIILWAYAHEWRKELLRSATIAISMPIVPFQAILMIWKFGEQIPQIMLKGLYVSPMALIGVFLGLKISEKVNVKVLRAIVMTILVIIGVMYVTQPYFR